MFESYSSGIFYILYVASIIGHILIPVAEYAGVDLWFAIFSSYSCQGSYVSILHYHNYKFLNSQLLLHISVLFFGLTVPISSFNLCGHLIRYGSKILDIKWHQTLNSARPKMITADNHIVRIWDPETVRDFSFRNNPYFPCTFLFWTPLSLFYWPEKLSATFFFSFFSFFSFFFLTSKVDYYSIRSLWLF